MICETCTYYGGTAEDNLIRFICGHHPNCKDFSINKQSFFEEFHRQVELSSERMLKSKTYEIENRIKNELIPKPEKEITSSKLVKKLYYYLSQRYYPIASNSYVYAWESDLLAINKSSHYIAEYEIKISRGDFKADFSKEDKHRLIADCYHYNFSSSIPNYFYYATPPGLLNKTEIPDYAGLIEVGLATRIVKRAPILHKDITDDSMVDILLNKVYCKYWGLK